MVLLVDIKTEADECQYHKEQKTDENDQPAVGRFWNAFGRGGGHIETCYKLLIAIIENSIPINENLIFIFVIHRIAYCKIRA